MIGLRSRLTGKQFDFVIEHVAEQLGTSEDEIWEKVNELRMHEVIEIEPRSQTPDDELMEVRVYTRKAPASSLARTLVWMLPEQYGVARCPFCGERLPRSTVSSADEIVLMKPATAPTVVKSVDVPALDGVPLRLITDSCRCPRCSRRVLTFKVRPQ